MKTLRASLPLQILVAVVLGIGFGALFPDAQLKPLSEVGKAVIHWVKLIAGPFLFLTILASIIEVQVTAKHGLKVTAIAVLNTSLAIVIGMSLAKVFLAGVDLGAAGEALARVNAPEVVLGWSTWVKTFMPTSLFAPFVQNDILMIALLALITGLAVRQVYAPQGQDKLNALAASVGQVRAIPSAILHWLILIIPVAVLTVVAGSVSEHGYGILLTLLRYVAVVILGFTLQIVLVYGTWIFAVARRSPREFWSKARGAVTYAFGVNSSLATLPLTMKALRDMGVSARSASLGAGVATNLNNDGIVLYEAMAVIFIAQLSGVPMSEAQMVTAALACIIASMGITGIPEAGFISLSVVVGTLGLPAEALPLLLAVDWMLARLRSVVNVLSDMTLSIALDATER